MPDTNNPQDEILTPLPGEPSSAFAGEVEAEDITATSDAPSDVAADDYAAAHKDNDVSDSVLETLMSQLDAANVRATMEHDSYLRALADYQNFKRRTEEERESLRIFLTTDLLSRFLPLVDNFDRALQAASQTQDYDKLIGGVQATHRQMLELLAREGVAPIEAEGEMFDPNLHNAVMREETTDAPEGTVLEELQRGYRLGNRVLRPTMVKVAAPADGATDE